MKIIIELINKINKKLKYKWIYITIEETGDIYRVPVYAIVFSKAEYYAKIDETTIEESIFKEVIEEFNADNFEILDWAQDNMNWEDVSDFAELVSKKIIKKVNWQENWVNGEWEIPYSGELEN